jgi:uric acid-xanthine permease
MVIAQDEELYKRIQGGITGDALSSFFAALATSLPNTTFSQNNGVISLTRCASRHAGLAAAGWLFVMGIFAKIAAFITTIPDCVLGGMTTFLFASVTISGAEDF